MLILRKTYNKNGTIEKSHHKIDYKKIILRVRREQTVFKCKKTKRK